MITTFASIGLSMLIPAISLRTNYKIYVPEKHLDEDKTGCYTCPYYRSDNCATCEKKEYYTQSRTVYINEKNRFGYRYPLKQKALLLYMYLHFLSPDENGYISKVDTEETAQKLHCTERTVKNNLRLLMREGYITAGKTCVSGYYQVFLNGYKQIFLKAKEGGRGFLRISSGMMEELTDLPDTNAVRLAIRSYINETELHFRPGANREKSIRDIKAQLPEYVTKKKLFSVFENPVFRKLFSVIQKKRTAIISLREQFNQEKLAEQVKDACRQEVKKLEDQINKETKKRGKYEKKYPMRLTEKDLSDISNIALRLPITAVTDAVRIFYETYVVNNINYDSAGALVRAYATEQVRLSGLM